MTIYYGKDVLGMTVRQINRLFRRRDESDLQPAPGRFNAADRAIRRLRKYARSNGAAGGYEYAVMLDHEIARIINRSA